jgi:hypothetical protein
MSSRQLVEQGFDISAIPKADLSFRSRRRKVDFERVLQHHVSPYNLSWNFHPFFIKTSLGIYLKDGCYQSNTLSSGVKVTSAAAIANNFWTFEPDLAPTYLEDGWNSPCTLSSTSTPRTPRPTTNPATSSVSTSPRANSSANGPAARAATSSSSSTTTCREMPSSTGTATDSGRSCFGRTWATISRRPR